MHVALQGGGWWLPAHPGQHSSGLTWQVLLIAGCIQLPCWCAAGAALADAHVSQSGLLPARMLGPNPTLATLHPLPTLTCSATMMWSACFSAWLPCPQPTAKRSWCSCWPAWRAPALPCRQAHSMYTACQPPLVWAACGRAYHTWHARHTRKRPLALYTSTASLEYLSFPSCSAPVLLLPRCTPAFHIALPIWDTCIDF